MTIFFNWIALIRKKFEFLVVMMFTIMGQIDGVETYVVAMIT